MIATQIKAWTLIGVFAGHVLFSLVEHNAQKRCRFAQPAFRFLDVIRLGQPAGGDDQKRINMRTHRDHIVIEQRRRLVDGSCSNSAAYGSVIPLNPTATWLPAEIELGAKPFKCRSTAIWPRSMSPIEPVSRTPKIL